MPNTQNDNHHEFDFETIAQAKATISCVVDTSTKEGQREAEQLYRAARIRERDEVNELPDELIAAAKKELEYQEWFIALPTNAAEDEAIFTLALEMLAAKTDHPKTLEEYKAEAAA